MHCSMLACPIRFQLVLNPKPVSSLSRRGGVLWFSHGLISSQGQENILSHINTVRAGQLQRGHAYFYTAFRVPFSFSWQLIVLGTVAGAAHVDGHADIPPFPHVALATPCHAAILQSWFAWAPLHRQGSVLFPTTSCVFTRLSSGTQCHQGTRAQWYL